MRAVVGRPSKVRLRLEQEDGTLASADVGTDVTVRVLDGTGTEISTGTAAEEFTGIYAYTLPHRDTLDTLTVEFTVTQDGTERTLREPVRLQDRRLVPLSVLRSDENLSLLETDEFLRLIDATEDLVDDALGFPAVLVSARVSAHLPGGDSLRLPGVHRPVEVYSLSYDGEAVADVKTTDDGITRDGYGYSDFLSGTSTGRVAWQPGHYEAHVTHGMDETPSDLQRAAATLAKYLAKNSHYPDRARRVMTEQTDIWLSSPGEDAPTGLPEVDAVLLRYRELSGIV